MSEAKEEPLRGVGNDEALLRALKEAKPGEIVAVPPPDPLRIWDRYFRTPPELVGRIEGGARLSTVPAYYRFMCLTKLFGPYGIGWGIEGTYEVIDLSAQGAILLKFEGIFWYVDGGSSHQIQTAECCKLATMTKNGWWVDTDAYKKVRTGAMTKPASILGISADIHANDNALDSVYEGPTEITLYAEKDGDWDDVKIVPIFWAPDGPNRHIEIVGFNDIENHPAVEPSWFEEPLGFGNKPKLTWAAASAFLGDPDQETAGKALQRLVALIEDPIHLHGPKGKRRTDKAVQADVIRVRRAKAVLRRRQNLTERSSEKPVPAGPAPSGMSDDAPWS